jgi:hypothetical protein
MTNTNPYYKLPCIPLSPHLCLSRSGELIYGYHQSPLIIDLYLFGFFKIGYENQSQLFKASIDRPGTF